MANVELYHWHDTVVEAAATTPATRFDVVADVVWTHEDGVTVRNGQAFFAGPGVGTGADFVFRFGAEKEGNWTGVTSSTAGALDGLNISHTVTALTNPNRSGYHVPDAANPTHWLQQHGPGGTVRRIAPRLCMWDAVRFMPAKSLTIRQAEVDNWADTFGMTGAHVSGPARNWFDLTFDPASIGGNWGLDTLPTTATPDPATFVVLEELIDMWLDKGGHVHVWEWADFQRTGVSTNFTDGGNGVPAQRIDRYIRNRLGPIPGWSMGYGFDNWENLDVTLLGAWLDRMAIGQPNTWFHWFDCRFVDQSTGPQDWGNCTDGVVRGGGYPACATPWNAARSSPPQVASWEQHWPTIVDGGAHTSTPQQIIDALAANTTAGMSFMADRPHFTEDRFFRRDTGYQAFRDFETDDEVPPVLEAYGKAGWGVIMGKYLGGASVSEVSQDWSNPAAVLAANEEVNQALQPNLGAPTVGVAVAISPQIVNLTGVVGGAEADSHEVWANEAPGEAFDGEIKDSLGGTLADTIAVAALDPLTEYNFGIRAIRGAESLDSNQVSATTLDVATWTLTANDTLVIAVASDDGVLQTIESVELRWGKYTDAAGGSTDVDLQIEVENDGATVETILLQGATLQPQNEIIPVDPVVQNLVNPRLHITALMPGGANGQRAALYWIEVNGDVLVDAAPPIPTNTVATPQSDTEILASWNASATATAYRLEFAEGATFPAGTGTQIFDGPELSFLHSGLASETQYAYRVLAYNEFGDDGWSDVFTATTDATAAPPTPTGFQVDPISTSEGDASWDPVPAGVDGYRIQIEAAATFPPGTGTLVFDGPGTPDNGRLMTILGGLDPNTEYAARLASYRFITQ